MDKLLFIFGPSPGPEFIHFESGFGSGFYTFVHVRNLSMASPDFMLVQLQILSIFESGSGFYQASLGPDFIHNKSESGSGFYQACPGPRSDFTNTPYFLLSVNCLITTRCHQNTASYRIN